MHLLYTIYLPSTESDWWSIKLRIVWLNSVQDLQTETFPRLPLENILSGELEMKSETFCMQVICCKGVSPP